MDITGHNDHSDRLRVVCDYYLDFTMALRDPDNERAVWPCPSCEQASFAASFEAGAAGCTNEVCEVPSSMQLLELVAYLDPELAPEDKHSAAQRFSQILEDRINQEQHRQHQRSESRQRAREESRWQIGDQRQRAKQQEDIEDTLF